MYCVLNSQWLMYYNYIQYILRRMEGTVCQEICAISRFNDRARLPAKLDRGLLPPHDSEQKLINLTAHVSILIL